MPKKINLDAKKSVFLGKQYRVLHCRHLRTRGDIISMLLDSLRPDNNIIQIDMAANTNHFMKSSHHSPLVSSWGIVTAHGHHNPFIEPEQCTNSGELNVIGVDQHLKKGVGYINLFPYLSFSCIYQDVLGTWQQVDIRNHILIEHMVVINPIWECRWVRLWN